MKALIILCPLASGGSLVDSAYPQEALAFGVRKKRNHFSTTVRITYHN